MSYILEALRRAESERERKRGVPGLHAQPVPTPGGEEGGERRATPWRWIALGLAAGVLLPLAWRLWSGDPAPDDAAQRAPVAGNVTAQANAGAAPATPAPAPAEPASAATAAPPDGGNATPSSAPAPAPAVAAKPPPKASPKHTPAAKSDPAHATAPGAPPPMPDGTAARSRAPAPANAPPPIAARPDANAPAAPAPATPALAAAPEQRLRTLAELPDDMRRSVPALAFGGSVYSDIAAQRMVIFNGQVLREGDPLSDDVMLEQIRPRSAVLRMRGQRFEVPF